MGIRTAVSVIPEDNDSVVLQADVSWEYPFLCQIITKAKGELESSSRSGTGRLAFVPAGRSGLGRRLHVGETGRARQFVRVYGNFNDAGLARAQGLQHRVTDILGPFHVEADSAE